MRFMMMIKSNPAAEAGVLPDEALLGEMGTYNQALMKAGVVLAGEGLQASSKGVRVRMAGHELSVIEGPFSEAKELIAGFWLIQTATRDEAIAWAKRVPGVEGELELRLLFELSDFPVDPSKEANGRRDQEQTLRDEVARAAAGEAPAAPSRRQPGTKRFMIMLKSDPATESDVLPDPKVMEAMGALMDEVGRSGALLGGEGLRPSRHGVRVKLAGDQRTVVDGPFTESKELIAGYTMLQTPSRDQAIEFAKRWLPIHVQGRGQTEGEIEIRQVFELEDFPVDPAEKPEGWRQQEQRARDRLGQ